MSDECVALLSSTYRFESGDRDDGMLLTGVVRAEWDLDVTASFEASNVLVASIVIVLLPALIIGVGELEERLRQRDSSLRPSVAIVRVWVVPLAAVWLLVSTLFEVDAGRFSMRLLGSALLLAIAAALLSAFRVVVDRIVDRPRRTDRRSVPRLLLAVPRLAVILVTAWWLIAGVWGVDLSAALTALGVTSLVVSFALQDTLGGIASGFTLLADQPFSPGDWVKSGDVEGRVIDVNWRSTRIENRDGDLVVIPNGQLSKATIVNFDQPSRFHRVMVPVQIERSAPPTAAKAMLLEAARSTAGVVADPPPVVFVTNIADPVVDYQAFMWVDDFAIVPRVRADFASLVWYLSYRHGVPLPNPAQDLYLFDGVQTATRLAGHAGRRPPAPCWTPHCSPRSPTRYSIGSRRHRRSPPTRPARSSSVRARDTTSSSSPTAGPDS